MASSASPPRLWQCSKCTYADNEWDSAECAKCGTATEHLKRPASPVLASIDRPNKLTKKVEEEKLKSRPPPQDTLPGGVGPFHPTGVVVEIVGTERSDQGRSCEEHLFNCGEVLAEDVVVRLRKVQILEDGKEETAIAAVWINDGVDRCRVGFLPRHMVKHAIHYDGAVAQITCVFSSDASVCDTAERRQFHKNHGCCLAAIIAWPAHKHDEKY